ncbi:lycopene cyclase family protein [Sphingomonas sp. LR55]|uniref:lycopene cyclase family protein n=1 Tax=Sphingomonas sp. LR55 TaxID=3050231 RepID=UPI002FDF6621
MRWRATWKSRGFYRMLDTMLFRAAEPEERYRILERFYRLSPSLIGRFYAGRSTLADKARVLTGKPPVPIVRAVRAIAGSMSS